MCECRTGSRNRCIQGTNDDKVPIVHQYIHYTCLFNVLGSFTDFVLILPLFSPLCGDQTRLCVTVSQCDHRDCEGGLIKPRPGHPLVRWSRMRQFLCSCSPLLQPAFTKKAAVPNWETDKKILIPTRETHKAHLLHPHVHLQGGRLGFEPFSKSENIIQK